LLPDIRFGTERYPEKVALRLRTINITAWLAAAVIIVFGFLRLLDPKPLSWRLGAINIGTAVIFLAIPLLHRFSPLAAPLAMVFIADAFIVIVSVFVGTDAGTHLYLLITTALGALLLGTERTLLSVAIGIVAIGLIVALLYALPHATGIVSPTAVFFANIVNFVACSAMLFAIVFYALKQMAGAEAALQREYDRSESLLLNILPPLVAQRLKQRDGAVIADRYSEASILFADMAGFTARASDTPPEELIVFLNRVFTRLDELVEHHGLEKIKTTGDAYMVVSGVPDLRPDHCRALADLALDMRDALHGLIDTKGREVPVRIGIASGPVVAGVVGRRKFFYDVWGDAVNLASRMESTGTPGRIQVSQTVYESLREGFDLESRGSIDIKGKGQLPTWFLIDRKIPAEPRHSAATP
jgi:adenylate cyclase